MSSKISALTAASSVTNTDQYEINQGGTSKRATALQIKQYVASYFIAQLTTSADVTYTVSDTRINYDTVVSDPFSVITTGASWVFTVPTTGGYMFIADEHDTDGLSNDWAAQATIKLYLYKSTSTYLAQLAYRTFDSAVTYANQSDIFTNGTAFAPLTAADTVHIKYRNQSGASRKLYAGARLTIMRVY